MKWAPEAESAIQRAPFFVRGLARRKAESVASAKGQDLVTLEDVKQARQRALLDRTEAELAEPSAAQAILSQAVKPEARELEDFVERASQVPGHKSRYYDIRVCGGAAGCPFALIDVQAHADTLRDTVETSGWCEAVERRVKGPILAHHKFRAAISGCPNACSEPQIRDFGIIGQAKPERSEAECNQCRDCVAACREAAIVVDEAGPRINYDLCVQCGLCVRACPTGTLIAEEEPGYKVTVGGKLGRHPHLADTLLAFTDENGVNAAAREVLELMRSEEGRLTEILARCGLESLREQVRSHERE